MISREEARTRVTRGAAHLDQVQPGWPARIDVDTFAMERCSRCALGQLYSDFWIGTQILYGRTYQDIRSDKSPEVREGFAVTEVNGCGADYRQLQSAWVDAIAARLHPVCEPSVTADAVSETVDALT